jgi:hypothetical protein
MKALVIGNFQPSVLDHEVIREEFAAYLTAKGYDPDHIEVRGPSSTQHFAQHRTNVSGPLHKRKYHQDGDQLRRIELAVWSNKLPTEVLDANDQVIPLQDGDVVLLDTDTWHCPPDAAAKCGDRWFVRAWDVEKTQDAQEPRSLLSFLKF